MGGGGRRKTRMKMLFERIGRLLQELDERRYPQEVPVESWKMKQTR